MATYGKLPKIIDKIIIPVEEMFHYTYLPIKLTVNESYTKSDIDNITLEPRLEIFRHLINICCKDYIVNSNKYDWYHTYVYLTVKNLYQKKENGFNRKGWHSDGFLTNDINYIWSDSQPTIFNFSRFYLSKDHNKALDEMESQAKICNNITFENNTILKLDQYVIHKVAPIKEGFRCFAKITFSKDRYNLIGNSINHELNYNWKMFPRTNIRNTPHHGE